MDFYSTAEAIFELGLWYAVGAWPGMMLPDGFLDNSDIFNGLAGQSMRWVKCFWGGLENWGVNVVSILQNKCELLWKVNEMDNCRSSDAGILQKNCGNQRFRKKSDNSYLPDAVIIQHASEKLHARGVLDNQLRFRAWIVQSSRWAIGRLDWHEEVLYPENKKNFLIIIFGLSESQICDDL